VTPCSQLTQKGEPCKNPAAPGSDRCAVHERGRSPLALLTPEVAERLVALIRAGNFEKVAARAAGVAPRTLKLWLQRGRSDREADAPYRELLERVERARAEGEAVHVARIAQAAQEDWRASAWYLERSYPERWGRSSPRPVEEVAPAAQSSVPAEQREVADLFAEVDELAAKRAQRPPL
jgi:hypothetical protein